ncbi:hypothetical protein HDK77DRAFT_300997 [Phyllosticta capitalensis]
MTGLLLVGLALLGLALLTDDNCGRAAGAGGWWRTRTLPHLPVALPLPTYQPSRCACASATSRRRRRRRRVRVRVDDASPWVASA